MLLYGFTIRKNISTNYGKGGTEMKNKANYNTIPVGQLGIIALPGCEELAAKIDHYLKKWRFEKYY